VFEVLCGLLWTDKWTSLSPPDTQDAPFGAFCVSGGERWVPTPRGFDGFAGSESGQPNGWPRSVAEGLGAWMHPTIPGPPITQQKVALLALHDQPWIQTWQASTSG
jgi:hypothetical protein